MTWRFWFLNNAFCHFSMTRYFFYSHFLLQVRQIEPKRNKYRKIIIHIILLSLISGYWVLVCFYCAASWLALLNTRNVLKNIKLELIQYEIISNRMHQGVHLFHRLVCHTWEVKKCSQTMVKISKNLQMMKELMNPLLILPSSLMNQKMINSKYSKKSNKTLGQNIIINFIASKFILIACLFPVTLVERTDFLKLHIF